MTQKYRVKTPIGTYYAWTSDNVNGGYCTSLIYPEDDSKRVLSAPGAIEPKTYKCKHFAGFSAEETHKAMNVWIKDKKVFSDDVIVEKQE